MFRQCNRIDGFAAGVVSCIAVSGSFAGVPQYSVIDIGAVPDITPSVFTPPTSNAHAINAAGVVGGGSATSGGSMQIDQFTWIAEPWNFHAVRWQDGELLDIGFLGPAPSPPSAFPQPTANTHAINALGQIVGDAGYGVPGDGAYHAFLWLPEPAYGLPAGMNELPPFFGQARAYDINDFGVIIGETKDPATTFPTSAMWTIENGRVTASMLGTDVGGIANNIAYGLNNLGQVVGWGVRPDDPKTPFPDNEWTTFIWLPEPAYGFDAGMNDLLPDEIYTLGNDINDLGQVFGRGTFWTPMIWLPEPDYGLPAGVTFFPVDQMFDQSVLDEIGAIGVVRGEFVRGNTNGVAVGWVEFAVPVGPVGGIGYLTQGLVWIDGEFILAEHLLPDDSEFFDVSFAWDVNDARQIVGDAANTKGELKGIVLTPLDSTPGDLDEDGDVDFNDLLLLLAAWGECIIGPGSDCPADLDDSGSVGFGDLLILLSNWR